MRTSAVSGEAPHDLGITHPLWSFLTALSGVADGLERARLIATGLPSLVPCRLSGVALFDDEEETWSLVLQIAGEELAATATEELLSDLERPFKAAFRTASILITTAESEDYRTPLAIQEAGVQLLALAPMKTLHHRLGVLLVGREFLEPLTQKEEFVLLRLAESSALGAENLRLRRTLEEQSQRLEHLLGRYQNLYNHTPVMMHSIDRDGKVISVNEYWLRTLGYEESEVLGRTSTDFLTEESRRQAVEENLPRFWRTGVAKNIEYQMGKKNGDVIDVHLSAVAEFDGDGKIDHMLAFIVDVTDRRRTEEALGLSEERFRKIFEHSNDAIFVIDPPRDRIVDVNDKACRMLGYSRDELLATPISGIHPDEMPALMAFTESVLREGHGATNELTCLTKRGDTLPSEMSASIVEIGGQPHMIALVRDISARKRAEQATEERTAELEAFSYSVSHDLRAPLRAIDGFSRILLEEYRDELDPEASRLLDVIRSNTQNMAQLIDDLLAFSSLGRQEMKPTMVDMRGLVASVTQELQSPITNRDVQCHIGELPPVRGDRAMIRQVVVNLLSNALKFTNRKASAVIEIGHTVTEGRGVYFVKDDGVGFDMAYADQLFGVFQRLHTQEEFEGTGVGLAIVHRIVQRHGGQVWAEGVVNEGATIYFTLSGTRE